jgi:hypothetical protein
MVLLITYDLRAPGRDYTTLHAAIKSAGTWWHHLESTWIIETTASPKQWYEFLAKHMDANDFILILQIQKNAWGILPKQAWEWLNQRNYA